MPPRPSRQWEKQHLWLYLLALGFDPAAVGGLVSSSCALGVNMFDAPNNNAFYVVAIFLFTKLDPSRAAATFGDCSFPTDKKTDPEFRKQCCSWLKDIADQCRNTFPQIVTSLFLSPGGPKFIRLMYQFARYVVIQDMKVNSVGTGIPFAQTAKLRPQDLYKAKARYRVAYNKFLQTLQKEDFIIQEYKKKSQLLIKEIKQIRLEYADMQIEFSKMKKNDQSKIDKTERIQKIRSMWTFIMDTLTSLEKEKEVVDFVLEGRVDQYALDGTDVTVSVPQLLADKIESEMYRLCIGNIHEAEKLNFLTVIQLLNEALRIFRDERHQLELKSHLQYIENMTELNNKILLNLKTMSRKVEREYCTSVRESISEKQKEWQMKWKSYLGHSPFCLTTDQDPELDLLPAMEPLSFHPATEEAYENSVFCQHPVSVSDIFESICDTSYEDDDERLENVVVKSTVTPKRRISSTSSELTSTSEISNELLEKDLHTETCNQKEQPVSANILKYGKDEPSIVEAWENTGAHVIQRESPLRKDFIEKAREQLAEEVAKAVMSHSPENSGEKGMELEDLISSLASNPFITRRQIPRTPENLLTEIRSSWRKAIQSEDSSSTEIASSKRMTEAPKGASPVMQDKAGSSLACSTSLSPVSDLDSASSERKSQLSWIEFSPRKQMKINHINEFPVKETAGISESERTEKQELESTVLNRGFVENPKATPYVKKSMNTLDSYAENKRTVILSSDHFQHSCVDRTRLWDSSPVVSSDSCDAAQFGIWHETLSELDYINSDESAISETDFDILDNKYLPSGTKNKRDAQADLQSVLGRYEMLKKTLSGNEEELCQTLIADESLSSSSELDRTLENAQKDELPLEGLFCLDEDFLKMQSPLPFSESKHSLSPLLMFSQDLEEMASMIHKTPFDFMHKLKESS
ncbi:HAUS augmin-like complex subunit 6 isoform X2 [Dromaius novaehollandiae]|uniref:HAUS augmin-like complex subunit 6 isoform X2 n=1 Tax=Dromaius novaehollandiae TaxID=8790 RepID=UPI00311F4E97